MSSVLLLALASASIATASPAEVRQPPAEHCLDTRQVDSVYQPNDTQLLVASGHKHYQLTLSSACPGLTQADGLSLRAPQGFVCGSGQETVVAGNQRCPVVAITTIDSRSYAQGARQSQHHSNRQTGTLETVEVTAKAGVDRNQRFAHGFVGTSDYCFDPAQMRSWTETPEGLQVTVNPRRNQGNATYAVELSGSCPMLSSSPSVFFRSGMGLGVICGNAGDRVLAVRDTFVNEHTPALAHAGSYRLEPLAAGGNMATAVTGQCSIQAVYPIHS
jgi:hypothetical protein